MAKRDIYLHHDPPAHHDHQHIEEHFTASETVEDIVIGMADGLTVPFALTAGLSGAVSATSIVITAGLAEIAAGSIAMGLGGYLAGRTAVEHYQNELKREYYEVEAVPHIERKEVTDFFAGIGLSPESQERIADELCRDKDRWVEFMMRFELGLEEPNPNRAARSARNIGLAYIAGGMVPLVPYFFVDDVMTGLFYSAICTVVFLFIFGWFKSKVTGQHPLWGALRVTFIGVVAAAAAYLIAKAIESGLH
jgi:VIT1/CCC1 family predicted Fe2+/Mn2+ transporter